MIVRFKASPLELSYAPDYWRRNPTQVVGTWERVEAGGRAGLGWGAAGHEAGRDGELIPAASVRADCFGSVCTHCLSYHRSCGFVCLCVCVRRHE